MKRIFILLAISFAIFIAIGCAKQSKHASPLHESNSYYNYLQPSFSEYLKETNSWLQKNRTFVTNKHEKEIEMNMPFELIPADPQKAILLIHGLGDSPFSFTDIAKSLAEQGFHVQVLLLPGHGSNPEHMNLPDYQDWQEIVDHYAYLLKEQYSEIWLGGFSTGANLVTIHAIDNLNVAGLMLFSPGFQSVNPNIEKLTPLVAFFKDGLIRNEDNIARYNSIIFNGAIQYTSSAAILRKKMENTQLTLPTMIVISEADSVIDSHEIKLFYENNFTHSDNILVWYGDDIDTKKAASTFIYPMQLEHLRIGSGSHMGLLYSPDNPYYGQNGSKIICRNSLDSEAVALCEAGEPIWFSAWGYQEEGKIFARLTWNPYFAELNAAMASITKSKSKQIMQDNKIVLNKVY